MSQINCLCGHTIRDSADDLPYKAYFFSDSAYGKFIDGIIKAVLDLKGFSSEAERNEWLSKNFGTDYPRDAEDSEIIHDILSDFGSKFNRLMYVCEKCGRVLLQEKSCENKFVVFSADVGHSLDLS